MTAVISATSGSASTIGSSAAEPDGPETVTGPGERPVATSPCFLAEQGETVGLLTDLRRHDGDDVVAELFHQVRFELVDMLQHRELAGIHRRGGPARTAAGGCCARSPRPGRTPPARPRLGLHRRTSRQLHSGPHLTARIAQVRPVRRMQPLTGPHPMPGRGGTAGLDLGHPPGRLGTQPFQTQQQIPGARQQITITGAPQILRIPTHPAHPKARRRNRRRTRPAILPVAPGFPCA